MNILLLIEKAFRHRRLPILFSVSEQLALHEQDDVMSFLQKPWSQVSIALLEKHFEAIFWLPPQAFCYYRGGIMSVSIKENRPWLTVIQSLVDMLDRSNDPASWDDFFFTRWSELTFMECEATQAWILWLSSFGDGLYSEQSLGRAFDTLDILKQRAGSSANPEM